MLINRKQVLILIIMILVIIMGFLFSFTHRCLSLPVWPVTEDPDGNPVYDDIIGFADGSSLEFSKIEIPPLGEIKYTIGDNWVDFPEKLNTKHHKPHTVHIHFNTNTITEDVRLIVSVMTDDPNEQTVGAYFDGNQMPQVAGKKIQYGKFTLQIFWLGSVIPGEHEISIKNETDPNCTDQNFNYGIYFDYVKLLPRQTIVIPDDYSTISEGIEASIPGDIIRVKKNKIAYKENIQLKSRIMLIGEDAQETIINGNGEGQTVIDGADQAQIKGFTIKNDGSGIGVSASHDSMYIANNIILSCSTGIRLTGQNTEIINNTMAENDYPIYVRKADVGAPIPSLICKNNIFNDGLCAIYILTDNNNDLSIDPNCKDQIIQEFRFNNILSGFDSNLNLSNLAMQNMEVNPFFVDTNNHNYHLMPYSPCIDAGDPNSDFSLEPDPNNGGRINLGAFGNTPLAQKTLDSDRDGALDYYEGPGDIDQDGRPDYLDNQTAVFKTSTSKGFELEVGAGRIAICLQADANTPLILEKVKALKEKSPGISGLNPPKSHYYYGFWEFTINGLEQGANIKIAILCPHESFFDFQEYYAYDPENGWSALQIQKDPTRSRIYITLSDGDKEDIDASENGAIFHRGAIAVPLFLGEEYDYKSCFISNL